MKHLAIVLALAGAAFLPALADQNGGIAGTVVDARTGQPMAHATLYYYKAPYLENGPNQIKTLQTNDRGFFADITLQPGRYVVMARFPNKVEGCAIDDVVGGETTHVKLQIGRDALMCSGPHIHPMTVDPNATADIYRI
jgi:hypothetical protein